MLLVWATCRAATLLAVLVFRVMTVLDREARLPETVVMLLPSEEMVAVIELTLLLRAIDTAVSCACRRPTVELMTFS